MSTRRARIKAVTSLPPRRKNVDSAENSKNKQILSKDGLEKVLKSPRTPRPAVVNNDEKQSPTTKTPQQPSDSEAPILISNEVINNVVLEKQKNDKISTPKRSEQVSVITATSDIKPNIFASPRKVPSPYNRNVFVSPPPLVSSPKVPSKSTFYIPPKISSQPILRTPTAHEIEENNELQILSNNVGHNTHQTTNNLIEDYNVRSVPESTEDAVMDGIVPLQPTNSKVKPDLLKNQIISEQAEVSFDPIIPLPSPSKVRPKLKPAPRLGPHRRNSIQGSASESEDESRRALLGGATTPAPARQRHDSHTSHSTLQSISNREVTRVRNDSVCSGVSQVTIQPTPTESDKKEKQSKPRRSETFRRMAASRRRRDTVKRDALTMYDLIYYNPTTNPIIPDEDEMKAKEANVKDEKMKKEMLNKIKEQEDNPDDPPEEDSAVPVPQIKLGPNGEIILDEQSLVINQTSGRTVSSVVREGDWASGGRYRRPARTADWSAAETVRFYRALAAIGTDFTLMAPLFPDRNRRDLKLKFKKEEKINGAQVDKALRSATSWDATRLDEEFKHEREEDEKRAERERKKMLKRKEVEKERQKLAKRLRLRMSKASKALGSASLPVENDQHASVITPDNFIQREIDYRTRLKTQQQEKEAQKQATENSFATLTRVNKTSTTQKTPANNTELASISKLQPIETPVNTIPDNLNDTFTVPPNIETGSLVVLTVNDPSSPSKKMLQTYIAHGGGKLTPVALPATFLNSVVEYMKKGTPKSTLSNGSSPQLTSPSSVTSHDSRTGVVQLYQSPVKRQRHASYTVTQF